MRAERWLVWSGLAVTVALCLPAGALLAGKGGSKGGGGGGDDGGGGSTAAPAIAYFLSLGDKLMVMDADGTNATLVRRRVSGFSPQPSWSPDGTRLVFNATIDGPGIYVVGIDGSGLSKIASTASQYIGRPVWSPAAAADGREKILFEDEGVGAKGFRDLFVVNPDGTGRRNVSNTPSSEETSPAWAPDAGSLAFVEGSNDGSGWAKDVVVADLVLAGGALSLADAENVTAGTDLGRSDLAFLDWSRDGSQLAVANYADGANDWDIWTLAADGSGAPKNVTSTDGAWERMPTWSPDGSRIAFWRDDGVAPGVFVMDADDGDNLTELAPGGTSPDWKR